MLSLVSSSLHCSKGFDVAPGGLGALRCSKHFDAALGRVTLTPLSVGFHLYVSRFDVSLGVQIIFHQSDLNYLYVYHYI